MKPTDERLLWMYERMRVTRRNRACPIPCSRPLEQAVIRSIAAIVAACRGLTDARRKSAA